MQKLTGDRASVVIEAPPAAVYALVADLPRMAEWSPEVVSVRWLDNATGAEPGARFEAVNQLPGHRSWTTHPVVEQAEPEKRLVINRSEPLAGTLIWSYELRPITVDGQECTELVESYEVTKPVSVAGWFVIERVFGGKDRVSELREGMKQTLHRIKEAAEAAVVAPEPAEG